MKNSTKIIKAFIQEEKKEYSKSELKTIKDAMEEAAKVYYEGLGDPIVTDEVFDLCVKKYTAITGEPFYGNKIESNKKLVDTEHQFPELVGTLDKVNSVREFYYDWFDSKVSKCRKDSLIKTSITLIISGKEDGNSVVGTFNSQGNTVQWLTRGRDGIGLDLTSLFKKVKIPVEDIKELSEVGKFGIKFEAVMTDDNLKKYSEESGKEYANSRSAVAGILSAKDGAKWIKYIQLVPLRIQTADIDKQMKRVKEFDIIESLCSLNNKRFLTPKYTIIKVIPYSKQYIIEWANGQSLTTRVSFLDYLEDVYKTEDKKRNQVGSRPMDGLVIEFADKRDRDKLGREKDRNKFDVALKFPYQVKETTVQDIEFQVGRSGRITPVVIFKPLIFNGATCDHVSISNYKRFKQLKLYKGCKVNIEYRNDVLCYLTRTDFDNPDNINPIKFITNCPICDSKVILNEAETFAYCENQQCPGRQIGKITNWLLKLGIKGINEKTIETLIKHHLLEDIGDLYYLKKEDLLKLEGFKEKASSKVIDLINSKKDIYDYELFGSLNIEGISLSTTRDICRKYNFEQILTMFKDNKDKLFKELIKIKNISTKTAEAFITGLEENYSLILRLLEVLSVKPSLKLENGKEFNIVFSGFRDKALEKAIEEKGWCYKNSVSSKTNLLIVLDVHQETVKTKKAIDLGVKIIGYHDFIKQYLDVNDD